MATSYGQVAVGAVVQVLMVPLYLAALGRYRFGVLAMLLSFVNVAALGVTWLSGGALRLLASLYARADEEGFRDVYTVSIWVMVGYACIISAGIAFVGTALVPSLVPEPHVATVRSAIWVTAGYFVVLYGFNIERVALTARGRQATANLLTIGSQILFVALAIPLLRTGSGLSAVIGALLAGVLVAQVVARLVWRRSHLHLPWRVRPGIQHRMIFRQLTGRMGAGYLAYGVLALALQSDTLLVGWIAGANEAATFVLVWRFAELAAVALWRIPDVLQPYIIHMDVLEDRQRLKRYWRLALMGMAGSGALVAVVYAALGQTVVALWVGGDLAPDGWMPYALAGGAVLWLSVARVPIVFAYATVRLGALSILMAAELVAKVVLIALLYGRWGFVAPLLAINLLHAGFFAWAYLFLGHRALTFSTRRPEISGVPPSPPASVS